MSYIWRNQKALVGDDENFHIIIKAYFIYALYCVIHTFFISLNLIWKIIIFIIIFQSKSLSG